MRDAACAKPVRKGTPGPGAERSCLGGGGGSYLRDRLLVPHGCLLDEVLHSYIPIPARNDHPGPPETHRHFHVSSAAAALIPMRKKARRGDKHHPEGPKTKSTVDRGEGSKRKVVLLCVSRVLRWEPEEEEVEGEEKAQR